VVIQQEATVQIGKSPTRPVKAGETVYVAEPARVSADGFYSIFVVPATMTDSKVELKLLPLPAEQQTKKIDKGDELNQLLSEVLKAQEQLGQKKVSEALATVQQLNQKWGPLVFFDYLKASAFILDRDYPQALQVVQAALQKKALVTSS
jgi:hypothetical protein